MKKGRFVTLITVLLVLCLSFATGVVFAHSTGGGVNTEDGDAETDVVSETPQKCENDDDLTMHIKILCVGNSFSQDCVAYMPFIAQGLTDQVEITLGIANHFGAGINDYIGFFDEDTASIIYNKKSPDKDVWTSTPDQTIKQILDDESWDIVTFQQKSGRQEDWSSYANLNELIDDVVGYISATHKKDVCVGWLMPQVRYKTATDSSFDKLAECAQKVLQMTPACFVIPCGTAVHYARQTGLNDLGKGGALTYDGVHLQEGLPCLLTAYVTTMKIMEMCGIESRSITDDQTRPVQDWVTAHSIPGQNGKSVGVTDENCRLAQELAMKAIRYPYGE